MRIESHSRPLVLHDAFLFPGGGERVALELSELLNAELVAGAMLAVDMPMQKVFGLFPLTSMADGRPCISFERVGLREIVLHEDMDSFIPSAAQEKALCLRVYIITAERIIAKGKAYKRKAASFTPHCS